MNEFEYEVEQIKKMGIKDNPLRLAYEEQVRALKSIPEELRSEGYTEERIAREMHKKRRELGRKFKEAAPPLFREYIYAATAAKYGDPLGPTYEILREKKSDKQIIESATRPIENLDNRLTLKGFCRWYKMSKELNELAETKREAREPDFVEKATESEHSIYKGATF